MSDNDIPRATFDLFVRNIRFRYRRQLLQAIREYRLTGDSDHVAYHLGKADGYAGALFDVDSDEWRAKVARIDRVRRLLGQPLCW